MDAQYLIKKGKVAVRTSGTLYPLYQNLFKEAFGFIPECPTCGSMLGHKHWDAFVAFGNGSDPNTLLIQNNKTMATKKTFEVKNKSKLYSYNFKKKGMDRVFTARNYGDVMTEEFAIAYLDSASEDKDLLDQRKSEFSILPSKYAGKKEDPKNPDDTNPADKKAPSFADLQQLAKDKEYPTEEWEKLRSKADLAAYITAKELEDPNLGGEDKKGDDLI